MALKATAKTLDEIDEKYRDLYVKNEDGTYRLDYDGAEDISGLKSALQRERELNKKKKEDGNAGLTATERQELEELRQQREKAEEDKLMAEKNWKGLEDRLKKKNQDDAVAADKKIKEAADRESGAKNRLYGVLKENAATQAISAAKGKIRPLLPHVVGNLDVVDEEGELKVIVKGKDGQIRYSKENPKDAMSVDELIKNDFLSNEEFMGVFEGTGNSGSGAQGSQGRMNGGTVTISRNDAKDAQKYRVAKEAATKAGQQAPVVVD